MAVSIVEVARHAGVSRMTVTRVMRNDPVREETKKRVLKSMRELGYVCSKAARALRSKDPLVSNQASCFALIFGVDTQKADDFFCEVTRGIERQAFKSGICPLQVHWLESFEDSWLKMQTVLSIEGLCGAILVGQFSAEEVAAIQKIKPHIVIIDGPIPPGAKVCGVETDNVGGCSIALKHLLECGSKAPVIITGPADHYFSRAIITAVDGFRDQFDSVRIIHTDYTYEAARSAVEELLNDGYPFDAVFGNDVQCIGTLRVLAERNITVPDRVKVIGFDNIPPSQFLTPSLTSIEIDKDKLGAEAVRMLIESLQNNRVDNNIKITINAELVKRESTGVKT